MSRREVQWPPLPPPKLKVEQLQLFLSVRNGSNRELVSTKVTHDNLVQFVEQGQVGVRLDKNNKNNNTTSSPIRISVPMGEALESHVVGWAATLRLVGLDTNQICAINKSDAVSVDGDEVKFLSQWLPLTPKGRDALERRIQAHDDVTHLRLFIVGFVRSNRVLGCLTFCQKLLVR
jgi:hypothetical protein